MSEEQKRDIRHKLLDEYLQAKSDADALRVQRRQTGEALRDLGKHILSGERLDNETAWEL